MKPTQLVINLMEKALSSTATFCYRKPLLTLALVALLTALSGWSASRLKVDTDMGNMLPKTFESVQNVSRLKKKFGGVGYVTIHVSQASPTILRRFAKDLAPKLEKLPNVRYVEYKQSMDFFKDRALYYIELPDLRQLKKQITDRIRWEKKKKNPLYVDLEDSSPPAIGLSRLQKKLEKKIGKRWSKSSGPRSEYYIKGQEMVLLVKPTRISTQLTFTRKVVSDVRQIIHSMDLKSYGPNLKVQLCGRYTKRVDQQDAIESDLGITSIVALLLMLLYLGIHFRRISAVFLVSGPLVIGLVLTFGFAALLVDKLNLLSAFFGAILLGLGVDHGIHLLSRLQSENREGRGLEKSIAIAFGQTGRAVLIAALTTIFAFIGLSLSEFRGFREFGQIAAAGVSFVVLAYVLILPALLSLLSRVGWKLPPPPMTSSRSWVARHSHRLAPWGLALGAIGIFGAITSAPDARFEYDFSKLNRQDLPSVQVDRAVDGILGRSQAPLIVLTQSSKDAKHVISTLRKRQKKKGSGIDFVVTTSDFIPKQQREKRKVILSIIRELEKLDPDDLEEKTLKQIKTLKRYRTTPTFTLLDLPKELRRKFEPIDGQSSDQFILVFASVDLSKGEALRSLARELRDLPLANGKTISAAGAGMVLADVLDMVFAELPRVMLIVVIIVFLVIWFLIGNLWRAILCLLPAAVTLIGTIGLLPLLDVQFNYLNIIMLPVLFGFGVDGGVHLVIQYQNSQNLPEILGETGRAIAGAILTTALGFGSLILAHHPGLSSLAKLTLIGLCCNLIATLIFLPALLRISSLLKRKNEIEVSP